MTKEEKTELKIAELSSYQVFGDTIQAIAYWHLSELKKAELRARIKTHKEYTPDAHADNRIAELQSELRKLEKEFFPI